VRETIILIYHEMICWTLESFLIHPLESSAIREILDQSLLRVGLPRVLGLAEVAKLDFAPKWPTQPG